VDIAGGPNGNRGFAVSPDGQSIVFTDGLTGQLYRQEVGQLDAVPVPGARDAWYPFFSPDGEWIGFIDQVENTLKKTRLDGSQLQSLAPVASPWRSAGWGPNGSIVVHSGDMEGLWRVRDSGGEPEPIGGTGGVGILRWLHVLPNGRGVLASTTDSIIAVSLETGERKFLLAGTTPRFVSSGHLVYGSENGLWAVPFDQERLETTGSAVPIVRDVGVGANALAEFAVGGGTLVYHEGTLVNQAVTPVWVRSDGMEEILDPSLSGQFRSPAVSPNGRKIAFAYLAPRELEAHIWIYDLDQRTFSRLTFEGVNDDPFWSPDGTEVGFSSRRNGPAALYARPVDLSTEARLLREDPDANLWQGTWTPDGHRIVYGRQAVQGGYDILQSSPHPDSASVAIVETLGVDSNPAISPDGRWLAYRSDQEGQPEVYVEPLTGPGGRLKVSTQGGTQPVWSNRGTELTYLALADYLTPLFAPFWERVTLRADGPTLRVEARGEPFGRRAYSNGWNSQRQWDLMPDDQRIIAIGIGIGISSDAEEEIEGRHIVVENFGEELKRLAPNP
jgi:serine/threonine-protein kinase